MKASSMNTWLIAARVAVALFCGTAIAQAPSPAQEPVVLAQGLKNLEEAPRIDAVLWTRRTTVCTLQVILPSPVYGMRGVRGDAPQGWPKPPAPMNLQVWLLKSDGSTIHPSGRWESPGFNAPTVAGRAPGPEVLFAFPLSAAAEAVTAVMVVDGTSYMQKLEPFRDKSN